MSVLRHFPGPAADTDEPATEEDVFDAYRLILKRDPDPAGLAHYRKWVADGVSLDALIHDFVHSGEYQSSVDRLIPPLVRSFITSEEYRSRQAEELSPTPVDLGGYQVLVQKLDVDFGQGILQSRQYEEHVRQATRDNLRRGDVAVDVGANIGVLTFLAASAVGPAGRVVAVEPNPDNLQLLYRGIVLNDLANVEVLPYAASNRRTVFSLTGGRSNTYLIGARPPLEAGHFVQSIVLDEALGHLPRLDFVKMDIEGHEPQAFDGFSRMIERYRPALLLEFNPRCLVNLQQSPLAFLKQLFAFYPRVRVTSAFADNQTFDSAESLLTYWERRDQEITADKRLPEGMLHFDLVTLKQGAG